MAQLLQNCPIYIPRIHYKEASFRASASYRHDGELKFDGCGKKWRRTVFVVHCSASTSSSSSAPLIGNVAFDEDYEDGNNVFDEYLVTENKWKVRRLVEEDGEMRRVAQVQAEAFHVPMPIFDDLFFEFFRAEVLAGLLYKLRNSASDRYACLVAEPATDDSNLEKELVGVVDVTVLRDESVLRHIEGADEYLYVSGIAVFNKFSIYMCINRRQKVATVLLKACDMLSFIWGYEYLVLRAYEDDLGARQLYTNAGYSIVSRDPPWMSTWIGRKCRVLMIKRSNLGDWC